MDWSLPFNCEYLEPQSHSKNNTENHFYVYLNSTVTEIPKADYFFASKEFHQKRNLFCHMCDVKQKLYLHTFLSKRRFDKPHVMIDVVCRNMLTEKENEHMSAKRTILLPLTVLLQLSILAYSRL